MKISDHNLGGASAPETQRGQSVEQAGSGTSGRSGSAGDSADRVEFSESLGALSRTVSSFQSDRAARVQSLATQYQNGSYRSDSAAISRGIVSEALSAGLK